MKSKAIILEIVFVLIIAINPNHAKAATMPAYLWADSSYLFLSVADLGMFGSDEWELLVVTDWPGVVDIGLGMRFYFVPYQQFGMTFLSDTFWTAFGYYGEWTGDGSVAYGRNNRGDVWERILYTTPTASQSSGDSGPEQQ